MAVLITGTGCGTTGRGNEGPQPGEPDPIALVGLQIVDVRTGTTTPGTILIEDGRIAALERASDLSPTIRKYDFSGAYVVPGLWDMHGHTTYANPREVEDRYFTALVAYGILGIRDMGSRFDPEQTRRWRVAISRGSLTGPRLARLGLIVDANATTVGTLVVRDDSGARSAIRAGIAGGYDFIKPYNDLSHSVYVAVVEEAHRHGLTVAGHLPYSVSAADAARLGQRSLEHLTNLWFEVSSEESRIRSRITEGLRNGERPIELFKVKVDSLFPAAFRSYDGRRELELFAQFVEAGMWQVPTLVADRYFAHPPVFSGEDEGRLLPRWVRKSAKGVDEFMSQLTPTQRSTLGELYHREAAMVGRMHQAGVPLLAGSDAPGPHLVPGLALHLELEAMVHDAGLTPLEAIQTATFNPARFLGLSDSVGEIAVGKAADLLIVDADPTADIRNLRRIRGVVVRGRVLGRDQLDLLINRAMGARAGNR